MKLIHECTFTATLEPPVPVGAGPIGTRMIYMISGGEITGERLNATVLGGGEWALIGQDGYLRVDVRAHAQTADGAFLYLQYVGLLEMNEKVMNVVSGGGEETDFGDQRFYTNPRIETGDPRYAWLNTTFFVGEGRFIPGPGVQYRVWRPA
jgi:hypothetical protein